MAETLEQAKAARDLIEVDYDVLPAVIDITDVTSTGAAVHDEAADNQCYRWHIGDKEGTDAAFQGAAHVTTLTFRNNRLAPTPSSRAPPTPPGTPATTATRCTWPTRTRTSNGC